MSRKSFDERRFAQKADVLNIVLDHINQGMVVVGPDYRLLAFNRHFEEMFQLSPGSVEVGEDFRDILRIWAHETGQDEAMLARAIHELDEPQTFEFEFPQLIKGETHWCLLTHNPLPDRGGFVRTFTNITRRKSMEACLVKLSQEDALTGLFNRRTLMEAIEAEVARSLRYQRPLSLLAIDIDHFKQVNDRWGHPQGDAVLKAFAAACRETMRDNDKVGRWGGEEFVVLLPETDRPEAERVASRLHARVAALAIDTCGGGTIHITASIGATAAHSGDSVETLLKRADDALYAAKAAGRDCVLCR